MEKMSVSRMRFTREKQNEKEKDDTKYVYVCVCSCLMMLLLALYTTPQHTCRGIESPLADTVAACANATVSYHSKGKGDSCSIILEE